MWKLAIERKRNMKDIILNNGVEMPCIGFGTVGIKGESGIELIKQAIHIGYRMIDTAHMYGNEKEVGRAVKESEVARSNLFITTKLNQVFHSYTLAKEGIEQSLENMQLDYIDLYLIHEPYAQAQEMYRALEEYYEKGLIRAIGISNYSKRKYDAFLKTCHIVPAINQIESHVYYPQLALKEYMETKGTKTQAWAPLAGGKKDIGKDSVLQKIGEKYNKTSYQVALRYLIQNEIIVIPKSHKIERIKSNMEVFDFVLTQQEMAIISSLDTKETLYEWMKVWE